MRDEKYVTVQTKYVQFYTEPGNLIKLLVYTYTLILLVFNVIV